MHCRVWWEHSLVAVEDFVCQALCRATQTAEMHLQH